MTRTGKKPMSELEEWEKAERMAARKAARKVTKQRKPDPDFVFSVNNVLWDVKWEMKKVDIQRGNAILKVIEEYHLKKIPIYESRNEIIASIPCFWLTAFEHHPSFSASMRKDDHEIFKYMHTVDVKRYFESDERPGYAITFHFKDNPFFENPWLSVDNNLKTISTTPIIWKEGMKGEQSSSSKESSDNCSPVDTVLEHMDLKEVEIIKNELWNDPLTYYRNVQ